jgi:hypothetical protein
MGGSSAESVASFGRITEINTYMCIHWADMEVQTLKIFTIKHLGKQTAGIIKFQIRGKC